MNYFELFEIPVSIRIDRNLLSKKYAALQRKYHPDFYTQASEEEKAAAMEKSSAVNTAVKIFRQEDETIGYVLQLKGILTEDEKYQLPPDFLMEMMELNESAEAGNAEEITRHAAFIRDEIEPVIAHFDERKTPEAELQKLKEYYFKKKYLQRILDRISD